MADIIKLLPDSVANQIAAGEVIQRPASAVKELLENAVDSGATRIDLIIKDAGRTLIQVIDNGCGMSEMDARMSLERHATSKIQSADDLFAIQTKGFRGEALASIVAVSQFEMKTKQHDASVGSQLIVEGSELKSQSDCATTSGTSMSIKNLFFNVPARRKFLKSDPVELRHIIDEFQRVAMAHPEIHLVFNRDGQEIFHLTAGNFRQRIVGVFGKNVNERLVPVSEDTTICKIRGFVGKPDTARKTKGEQFFFVNHRFIKNGYLHNAVANAYQNVISKELYPSYFIQIEIDPSTIDINIHPTKTEIKFSEERNIYALVNSAVKTGLGKYHVTPALDFEQETAFEFNFNSNGELPKMPEVDVDKSFNPFEAKNQTKSNVNTQNHNDFQERLQKEVKPEQWDKYYAPQEPGQMETIGKSEEVQVAQKPMSILGKYILSPVKSGLMLVHFYRAWERITYERYLNSMAHESGASQQLMFPATLELSKPDVAVLTQHLDSFKALGFDIQPFGNDAFIVRGMPVDLATSDAGEVINSALAGIVDNQSKGNIEQRKQLATSIARSTAAGFQMPENKSELESVINELFACEIPYTSPTGNPVAHILNQNDLDKFFSPS